jgi:GNAT superfamily N-acetyltransferase
VREIRKLEGADLVDLLPIVRDAFPAKDIAEAEAQKAYLQTLLEELEDPTIEFYGLYQDHRLLGGMRLTQYEMNLRSVQIPVGGVGLVAVGFADKRLGVGSQLIEFFLEYNKAQGRPLALLYPFRTDFYKKMGFGYGTKMNQYRLEPAQFPLGSTKKHIRFLTADDKEQLMACYHRYQSTRNGLLKKTALAVDRLFADPENRIVGYVKDDSLGGYLVFNLHQPDPANPFFTDMILKELVYTDAAARDELFTFLYSQRDQINRVIYNTQEEYFHFLFDDPRNGSNHIMTHLSHETNVSGLGLMYKVLDGALLFRFLQNYNFGGVSCRVLFNISDPFPAPTTQQLRIDFIQGRPHLDPTDPAEVEVTLGISEFSSLLVGSVDFLTLHRYGLATISDPSYLPQVDRLFWTPEKPICTTTI